MSAIGRFHCRTKFIILFLRKRKENLLNVVPNINTSATSDLKVFEQLKSFFPSGTIHHTTWKLIFCQINIWNVKHHIYSTAVYTSVLFTLTKIITNVQNLMLRPHCLTLVFFYSAYWTSSFVWIFSTVNILSFLKFTLTKALFVKN